MKDFFLGLISENYNNNNLSSLGYRPGYQKRALISAEPEILKFSEKEIESHHPQAKMMIIVLNVLINRGFRVDYFRHNQTNFEKKYDLVIGFGETYRKVKLNQNGKRILFLTENDPKISYEMESKRLNSFNIKYKKKYKINRSGKFYTANDIYLANAVFCIGKDLISNIKKIIKKKVTIFQYLV